MSNKDDADDGFQSGNPTPRDPPVQDELEISLPDESEIKAMTSTPQIPIDSEKQRLRLREHFSSGGKISKIPTLRGFETESKKILSPETQELIAVNMRNMAAVRKIANHLSQESRTTHYAKLRTKELELENDNLQETLQRVETENETLRLDVERSRLELSGISVPTSDTGVQTEFIQVTAGAQTDEFASSELALPKSKKHQVVVTPEGGYFRKLDQSEDQSNRVQKLEARLEKVQTSLDFAKSKSKKDKQEMDFLQREADKLRAESEKHVKLSQELKQKLEAHEAKSRELENEASKQLKELRDNLNTAFQHVSEWQERALLAEDAYATALAEQKAIDETIMTTKRLEEQLISAESIINDNAKFIDELQTQNQKLKSELELLVAQTEKSEYQQNTLISSLNSKLGALEAEKKALESKSEALAQEMQTCNASRQCAAHDAELQRLKLTIKDLDTELDDLKPKLKQLEEQLSITEQRLADERKATQKAIADFTAEQKKTAVEAKELADARKALSSAEQDIVELQETVQNLKEIAKTGKLHEVQALNALKEKGILFEQNKNYFTELSYLREKLKKLTSPEMADLQKQLQDARTSEEEAIQKAEKAEKALSEHLAAIKRTAELEGQLSAANSDLEMKRTELRNLTDEMNKLRQENGMLRAEDANLKQQQLQSQLHIGELTAHLDALAVQCADKQFYNHLSTFEQTKPQTNETKIGDLIEGPLKNAIDDLWTRNEELRSAINTLLGTRLNATSESLPAPTPSPMILTKTITASTQTPDNSVAAKCVDFLHDLHKFESDLRADFLEALITLFSNFDDSTSKEEFLDLVSNFLTTAVQFSSEVNDEIVKRYAQLELELSTAKSIQQKAELDAKFASGEFERMKNRFEQAQKQKNEDSAQIANYRKQFAKLEHERQQIFSEFKDTSSKLEALAIECNKAIETIDHYEKDKQTVGAYINELLEERDALQKHINQLTYQIESDKENVIFNQETANLRAQLEKQRKEHEKDKDDNFKSVRHIARTFARLRQLCARRKSECDEWQKTFRKVITKIDQMKELPTGNGQVAVHLHTLHRESAYDYDVALTRQKKLDEEVADLLEQSDSVFHRLLDCSNH